MDTSSDQAKIDAWVTKSGLCCQIHPSYMCSYCPLKLCEDCSNAREEIKSILTRVRNNWSELLPGVKPCSDRVAGRTSTVFDGHLF